MLEASAELNDEEVQRDPEPAKRRGISKYKIALVLAVVAIGFYALSIVSIVYTRGGAG